jgi:ethanolamine transporter EutH
LDLFKFREATLYKSLIGSMAAFKKEGKSGFEILTRLCSDNIQDLAMAYGERNTLEQSMLMLNRLKNAENKKVMTVAFRVFAIDTLKRDLGFYLKNKTVSAAAARALLTT